MRIEELCTPCILLDLDKLERNIAAYQQKCDLHHKKLWPMVKTHKSLELAKMQAEAGAEGFLCGTLDECEALREAGYSNIMYAYPVAGKGSIDRVIRLAQGRGFILRLDGLESAHGVNEAARAAGVVVDYTVIIDCGLHRFGIPPREAAAFVKALTPLKNLRYRGISSHSGQVYAATAKEEVPAYGKLERDAVAEAVQTLTAAGYPPDLVTTGSTPTFALNVGDENIGVYHPGNYVFNDCIQLSNGVCKEEHCALSVLATVISHPGEGRYIVDAGAKCLGLDQGAHGNASIVGHGRVKGHPELTLSALSEEVGKLTANAPTNLKVGDKIEIIPNHACSSANLTAFYTTVRGGSVVGAMKVDVRGNGKSPALHR